MLMQVMVYALAESAEDIMEALEDFVNRLRPKKNYFYPVCRFLLFLDNSDKRLIAILSLDQVTGLLNWSFKNTMTKGV